MARTPHDVRIQPKIVAHPATRGDTPNVASMVLAKDDRAPGGPMGQYTHLTLEEREEITVMRRCGALLARMRDFSWFKSGLAE